MLSISGTDFFKLPRTRAWYRSLILNVLATVAMGLFLAGSLIYDDIQDPDSPTLHRWIVISSVSVFVSLSAIAWSSATLCHAIQIYRGVYSLYLRLNSIFTFFVALLYALMIYMEMRMPIIYLDMFTSYTIVCVFPMLILVVLKLYIGLRLIRKRMPRLGGAILAFWGLFSITVTSVIYRGLVSPYHVFNWFNILLSLATVVMGANMMFRYAASSLILTYYPREYQKDLERYNKADISK